MSDAPKTPRWEPVVVLLAVVALWPKVFAPDWAPSDVLMYAALAAMAVVFVNKVARYRRLWRSQERAPRAGGTSEDESSERRE